jgi:methionyl-tRNA formyltransferase
MKPTIVFFGSFQHYSTYIAQALLESSAFKVASIITTPPLANEGNTVYALATKHSVPTFTPNTLDDLEPSQLFKNMPAIDLFVTAGYGKLLPSSWLQFPRLGALNLHFSLLPNYRGANPAEYALLRGESETGITLITMGSEFDTGNILSQTAIDIEPHDTRESLYEKLYQLGADCIQTMISEYLELRTSNLAPGLPQPHYSPTPDAKRLHRRDGYIAWATLTKLMQGQAIEKHELPTACQKANVQDYGPETIERASRALQGYPSLWTRIPTNKGKKMMKLFSTKVAGARLAIIDVQVEGQQKARFNQIKNMIITN